MYMKDKKYSVRVRLTAIEFEFLQNRVEVHDSTLSSEVRDCIWHTMIDDVEFKEKVKNGDI